MVTDTTDNPKTDPPGYEVGPDYEHATDEQPLWCVDVTDDSFGSVAEARSAAWKHYNSHEGYRDALAEVERLEKRNEELVNGCIRRDHELADAARLRGPLTRAIERGEAKGTASE